MLRHLNLPVLLGVLLVSAVVTTFSHLDGSGLERRSECRTAVVAREMLESGDYVMPTINGRPRLKKPPVYYWAILPFAGAEGGVTETAARLPSVVSATLLVVLTGLFAWYRIPWTSPGFQLGEGLSTRRRATVSLLAALLLVSMPGFWMRSTLADAESMLALACFAVSVSLYWNLRRPHRGWLLSAYVFSALALMIKGPIFLLFTWPVYVWLDRRNLRAQAAGHLVGLSLVAAFALSWYGLLLERAPNVLDVFSDELSMRFKGGAIHSQPFYFYAYQIFITTLPVALWLPVATWVAWSRRRSSVCERYLWGTALLALLGLTVLQTKQSHYLMPLYPFLALLVSDLLVVGDRAERGLALTNRIVLWLGLIVVVPAAALIVWYGFTPGAAVLALLALAALVLLLRGGARVPAAVMTWLVALAVAGYWLVDVLIDPVKRIKHDQSGYFQALRRLHAEDGLVASLADPCFFYGFGQRLPQERLKRVKAAGASMPGTKFVVTDEDAAKAGPPGTLVAAHRGHGGWLWKLSADQEGGDERLLFASRDGRWRPPEDFMPGRTWTANGCGRIRVWRGTYASVLELHLESACAPRAFVDYLNAANGDFSGQLVRWKVLWLTGSAGDFWGDGVFRERVLGGLLGSFVKHQGISVVVDSVGAVPEKALKNTLVVRDERGTSRGDRRVLAVAAAGDRLWLGESTGPGSGSVKRTRVFRQGDGADGLIPVDETLQQD